MLTIGAVESRREAEAEPGNEPIAVVEGLRQVDDAGGVQYEGVWTAGLIVDMIAAGTLRREGNIRPDHGGRRRSAKVWRKIRAWANELLRNDAVLGNCSVRLDPEAAEYELEQDEDGDWRLMLHEGYFDTAIDSQSRIEAILLADGSPTKTMRRETRVAVRIWICTRAQANRVATIYNTRGDKVNESTARSTWQETPTQQVVHALFAKSPHLGIDNVEVLGNTVSASSAKLCAYNTLVVAANESWTGEPRTELEVGEQAAFLIKFWDALVRVRPEYGHLKTPQRKALRGSSMAGTALSIHGLMAVADRLRTLGIDPSTKLAALAGTVTVDGAEVDYFSYDNPRWTEIGALSIGIDKKGVAQKQIHSSYQTRSSVGTELLGRLGLDA